jgi:uncharacterized protein DUF5996
VSETDAPQTETWPALPLAAWRDTYATLHRWLQIVGKVRLVQSPWFNHCWQVTLYVTPTGLNTSAIPYDDRTFQIDLDFARHRLAIRVSDGGIGGFALEPMSVAAFYARLMQELSQLDLEIGIYAKPNECADATPFAEDQARCAYDAEYAHRFARILAQADRVFKKFRGRFIGKASPVHFFWGAPDLAVTRFSGRRAPRHPGGIPNLPDRVTQDAYSHEVSSAGFWPGGGAIDYPAFYSYAYPEPKGFAQAKVKPDAAFYSKDYGEFILPYDAVRLADDPDATLLEFLQSTYEAAADLAKWDRKALEAED